MVSSKRKKRCAGISFYIFLLSLFLTAAVIITVFFCKLSAENINAPIPCAYCNQQEKSKLINVPYVAQNPDFPTGCESVSAVMLLNYYGYSITADSFIDGYLDKSDVFYTADGKLYGPNPSEVFVGNPRKENSFGCYEPVIEKALNKFLGAENRVCNTSGKELQYLCESYIDNNIPVLIWASIGMKETYSSTEWTLENGDTFTWISGEHCLVLVGYDDEKYYFNDPLVGAAVGYDKTAVEYRYEELGRQSLILTKTA